METRGQSRTSSIGLLILRFGMGGFLLTHGWGKLQTLLAGNFDQFADPIGLGTGPSLVLAVGAEAFCAVLVMAGLITRLAAVPPVITMLVAAFVVHASDPWTMGGGAALFQAGEAESWASREPALLYLFAFLTLVFTGPGKFSVDALIRRRRRRTQPSNS